MRRKPRTPASGPILALAMLLLGSTGAAAQGVKLDDDQIEILDGDGDELSSLDGVWLRLGGAGAGNGLLQVVSLTNVPLLQASPDLGRVSIWGDLELFSPPNGPQAILLEADLGDITLGGSQAGDGDIVLKDNAGFTTMTIDGNNGTAENTLAGNGFIKGWARIDKDGNVLSCYRCDAAKTSRTALGTYYVDFSPVGSNLVSRPRIAVIDRHGASDPTGGEIWLQDDDSGMAANKSRIKVVTGPAEDRSFTITVF